MVSSCRQKKRVNSFSDVSRMTEPGADTPGSIPQPAFKERAMVADDCIEYRSLDEVLGFSGYRVGSDGTFWSCKTWRGVNQGWRQLKGTKSGVGYLTVKLGIPSKTYTIHVLVATAFHGPCPDGMECRHLDGSRTNNQSSNLEWGTRQQNCHDAARHGTSNIGERHPHAKLSADDVWQIR